MTENRHPAGTSVGGQFAPGASDEVEIPNPVFASDSQDLAEGQMVRVGDSYVLRGTRGLTVLSRRSPEEVAAISTYVFDDQGSDGDEEISRLSGGRGLSLTPETKRVFERDHDASDFDDADLVRAHLEKWSSPDVGSTDGSSDLDVLRKRHSGPFVLGDEADSLHAQKFVADYDGLGARARRGRPSPERFADLDRRAQKGSANDADDVEAIEETFGVPFDPQRPPLRFIDEGSRESTEAQSHTEMPGTAFAYTRGSAGEIDQVFSVGRNDFGDPTIHVALAYDRASRESTRYNFGDYTSTATKQRIVNRVREENEAWKKSQARSGLAGWVRGIFS